MKQYPYERPIVQEILTGFGLKKKLMHVITGPRQVGKTTAAVQISEKWNGPVIGCDGGGGRLLQHDFAEPHAIRIAWFAGLGAPRQIAAVAVVPREQPGGKIFGFAIFFPCASVFPIRLVVHSGRRA